MNIRSVVIMCCTDGASASSLTSAVSGEATVAEAFLRMFVETCGHYDTYINTQQNGERIFQVLTAVFWQQFFHFVTEMSLEWILLRRDMKVQLVLRSWLVVTLIYCRHETIKYKYNEGSKLQKPVGSKSGKSEAQQTWIKQYFVTDFIS